MKDAPGRLVIAGAGGDSGKTLVSLGLVSAFRERGLTVSAFKKGPDYIDAAWLTLASGRPARNLDVVLMGADTVRTAFRRHAALTDLSVVEGNRGVFDGYGGESTASLARLLDAPVVLVVDATKVTRTAAAFVAGCRALDPGLRIAGVVANRVRGRRHAGEVRGGIEDLTGIPVLGTLPRLSDEGLLPHRHLGLVPPAEHERRERVVKRLAGVLEDHVDLDGVLARARRGAVAIPEEPKRPVAEAPRCRVGVVRDPAFTFYYPENIEALEAAGASIVPFSALDDPDLPDVDLLYVGGGFPETFADRLAANRPLLASLVAAVEAGLPVYAECGGLVWLSRSVTYRGRRSELAGVLPLDIVVEDAPQGHGYAEMVVTGQNPFFPLGTVLRGHEFHYSRPALTGSDLRSAFSVRRGSGNGGGRDGLTTRNVLATWLHVHAGGEKHWAPALVGFAAGRKMLETG